MLPTLWTAVLKVELQGTHLRPDEEDRAINAKLAVYLARTKLPSSFMMNSFLPHCSSLVLRTVTMKCTMKNIVATKVVLITAELSASV